MATATAKTHRYTSIKTAKWNVWVFTREKRGSQREFWERRFRKVTMREPEEAARVYVMLKIASILIY